MLVDVEADEESKIGEKDGLLIHFWSSVEVDAKSKLRAKKNTRHV